MYISLWKPDDLISSRDGRCNYRGRDYAYTALNRFGRKLSMAHHSVTTWRGDWWTDVILCSMQSFYDVLKLKALSESKPRNCKIIIGGPACNNIRGYLDFIDAAYFGRCDGNKILSVVKLEASPSLWIKEGDPTFCKTYTVDEALKESFLSEQKSMFGEPEYEEKAVGCPMKCSFCHYSHFNKFVRLQDSGRYNSGVAPYEDFFNTFSWGAAKRGGVTALDGSSERTRFKVNKKIRTSDIRKKLLEVNQSGYEGLHRVKIYNIYGYPWECPSTLGLDLWEVVSDTDTLIDKNVLIKMQQSHFIPYVKTPMAGEPFNFEPFHQKVKEFLFVGQKIKLFPGTHNQSPKLALLATIIQRAREQLPDSFFDEKLWRADFGTVKQYAHRLNAVDLGKINYDVIANVKTDA